MPSLLSYLPFHFPEHDALCLALRLQIDKAFRYKL